MKKLFRFFFRITAFRLAMAITVLVGMAYRYDYILRLPQQIEWRILDFRFRSRGPELQKAKDSPVTIVAIDEKTINELGRWPFSRSYMGDVVKKLREYDTKVIAFDIVFAEEDQNSELNKVREIRQLASKLGIGSAEVGLAVSTATGALRSSQEESRELANLAASMDSLVRRSAAKNGVKQIRKSAQRVSDTIAKSEPVLESMRKQQLGMERMEQFLAEAELKANNDLYLSNILKQKEDIVLGYFMKPRTAEFGHLGTQETESRVHAIQDSRVTLIRDNREGDHEPPRILYGGGPFGVIVPNIPAISAAGKWDGHFVQLPDGDGAIRWYPTVVDYRGGYYPSLGVMVAARYLDESPLLEVDNSGSFSALHLGEKTIPIDYRGLALLNYRGGTGSFHTVSFVDVLRGEVSPDLLRDRIALIGPTATGIFDLRVTPFDAVLPGVEIHANAISNILEGDFLQKPFWMLLFDMLSLLAIGLALGLFLAPLPSFFSGAIAVAVSAGYFWLADYMLWQQGIWLTTVYQVANILLGFVTIMFFKYMTEEKKKKEIRNAFQFYLNPEVVDEVIKDPDRLRLGGEKKELSILFSDIRGFTSISEKLDAQDLSALLNEYLTPMTNLVFDYKGTLDKYIGDALMAFFGAPLAYTDGGHAWRSCHVAIQMLDELTKLQDGWREQGLPELDIGIGINTGECSVGNMGSAQRFDYTVLGDAVNLAARLEGTNKMYGTRILISEFTLAAAGDRIYTREIDAVRVKGKLDPVRIYELMGKEADPALEPVVRLYETGLEEYRACRFDDAIKSFEEAIQVRGDDPPSSIFIERCLELRNDPPAEGWDGVFTLKTK